MLTTHREALGLVRQLARSLAAEEAASSLDLHSTLADSGLDSVTTLELVGLIEEELQVRFPDEEVTALRTVSELVELMVRATEAPDAAEPLADT